MKAMPKIQKFMTPMPHTIGDDIAVDVAQSMMREHHIRHLPVQRGGRLVGVITDRDVKFGSSFAGTEKLKVSDVMTPEPYIVHPETSLDQVVAEMAEKKYGCAIIEQGNHKVVGIFTAVDGLRVLSDVLAQNYRPSAE